ncbi:DUF397 domain-containing protein [Symbioplanes lichenis]|uniref:DUF397 domain-containing protein n=1 Tax=Symbioplanes lichenis TaxID=1629072 RepID=UPI0027390DFD|nr:DUF397 domain-containing protein [Actinoplanes lichenis]
MTDRDRLAWRKSTRSASGGCVEIAVDPPTVLIRDSKDPAGPALVFDLGTFREFIAFVKENPAGA